MLAMLGIAIYIKPRLLEQMRDYNNLEMNISLYSIMVRNLPQTTTKQQIINYFSNLTKHEVS